MVIQRLLQEAVHCFSDKLVYFGILIPDNASLSSFNVRPPLGLPKLSRRKCVPTVKA